MKWYKIIAEHEIVVSIRETDEQLNGTDAEGLGISVHDSDGNELFVDACKVSSCVTVGSRIEVIALFNEDDFSIVINTIKNGEEAELMYA